ncbi:MAG TPA: hypothetical protein VN946_22590 [Terriglobales bacterium]|jgi:hypothetical protein|nr:hypothetical protein [Terriglobales bacterium]
MFDLEFKTLTLTGQLGKKVTLADVSDPTARRPGYSGRAFDSRAEQVRLTRVSRVTSG